jgi:hypothetical protein
MTGWAGAVAGWGMTGWAGDDRLGRGGGRLGRARCWIVALVG